MIVEKEVPPSPPPPQYVLRCSEREYKLIYYAIEALTRKTNCEIPNNEEPQKLWADLDKKIDCVGNLREELNVPVLFKAY